MKSIVLFLAWVIAILGLLLVLSYVGEEVLERRSLVSCRCENMELEGHRIEDLFRRAPVVPDSFVFHSQAADAVVLCYNEERIGFRKYPSRQVFCVSNVVVWCESWRHERRDCE